MTPWAFVDKAEVRESMEEGDLGFEEYEEAVASLYKY